MSKVKRTLSIEEQIDVLSAENIYLDAQVKDLQEQNKQLKNQLIILTSK